MKTGKVANLFHVDPNTITGWTDRYKEFFTEKARGEGQTQREYEAEDLIVLNTIRNDRVDNVEWEKIRARLESGDLDTKLPPEFLTIEGENAIMVYTEVATLRAANEYLTKDNERLKKENAELNEKFTEKMSELNQQVGKWRALYEYLKEQGKE